MLIPGSHKANFEHPIVKEKLNQLRNGDHDAMRDVDGAACHYFSQTESLGYS